MDVKIKNLGQNTTGQDTGGHLRLRGPLRTARFQFRKETDTSRHSYVSVRQGGFERSAVVYEDIFGELEASDETIGGHQYHILVIELNLNNPGTLAGLILQSKGVRFHQFRRRGLVHFSVTETETSVPHESRQRLLQHHCNVIKQLIRLTLGREEGRHTALHR